MANHEMNPQDVYVDPVIQAYKKDVDRTIIREMLKLTVQQRIEQLEAAARDIELLRAAMKQAQATP
jgi:hypothetical protein